MSSLTRIVVLSGVAALGYYAMRGARASLSSGWQRHGADQPLLMPKSGGDGMAATPPAEGISRVAGVANPGEALQRHSRPALGFPTRDSNDGDGVVPGLGDYARGA
ncbi:hypothetical protein OU995_01395 [Roseateles sp. SL47]|uniref:hypothetical protein n=1 Tax=Roseateles sp. SL47 TaxID=2995138 RepID=UPI002270F3D4|nr:hypothetical protein [Roseateles sp. SL47]WAC73434.1 hypothetical protein OU995_01395 [Roseateles sp. SL47]